MAIDLVILWGGELIPDAVRERAKAAALAILKSGDVTPEAAREGFDSWRSRARDANLTSKPFIELHRLYSLWVAAQEAAEIVLEAQVHDPVLVCSELQILAEQVSG